MSILSVIITLLACIVSGVAGSFGTRFIIERNREIAEREDPRDTQIRDLQAKVKLARTDMKRDRVQSAEAVEHLQLAHDRIRELLDRLASLQNAVDQQKNLRHSDVEQMEILRDKLSAANRQLDTLKQRHQELEVELSVARDPDLLTAPVADEDDDADMDTFEPTVTDGSPSLIQSLTDELDRWKRHCHVLGDELKNQRERTMRVAAIAEEAVPSTPEIDELTEIRGIGNVLARKLHQLGIYRYETLLNLSADDLERARQLIPDFDRRLQRDDWIGQARMLQQRKRLPDPAPAADRAFA